jgi:hypothetical protein
MAAKKKAGAKSALKVRDMKAKKNPKGGSLNFTKNNAQVDRKAGDKTSHSIIAI